MFGYCDSKMKTEASMSMQSEGTGLRDKGLRKRLNNFFFPSPLSLYVKSAHSPPWCLSLVADSGFKHYPEQKMIESC